MIGRLSEKFGVLLARFASQATRAISPVVLGRMVAEEEYGRYGLILVVPGFLSAFGDLGVSRSIATNPELPEEQVRDTAMVMMLTFTAILATLAISSGWYYDVTRGDPRLKWVGMMIALSYLAQSVQCVQMALLHRDLAFARWAGIEWLTTLATVLCGASIALAGGGVFALAAQQLLTQAIGLALTARSKPIAWPRHFHRPTFVAFYSFGWRTSLFQYANNLQNGLSSMLIGWPAGVAGDALVGRYGRANQVRDIFGFNLLSTFDYVLSPLLARAREDRERFRDLYLRGTIAVVTFLAFSAAWLSIVTEDLVRVFLGPKWPAVPPIVVALAPGMVLAGVGYTGLLVALALKKPLVNLVAALATLVGLMTAGAAYGYTRELVVFAGVQSAFAVIPGVGMARWACHACGTSFRHLLRLLAPVFLWAGVTLGVGFAVKLACAPWLDYGLRGVVARLVVVSAAGGIVGASSIYCFSRSTYNNLVGLMLRQPAYT